MSLIEDKMSSIIYIMITVDDICWWYFIISINLLLTFRLQVRRYLPHSLKWKMDWLPIVDSFRTGPVFVRMAAEQDVNTATIKQRDTLSRQPNPGKTLLRNPC